MLLDVKILGLYLYDWTITLGVVVALIIFLIYADKKYFRAIAEFLLYERYSFRDTRPWLRGIISGGLTFNLFYVFLYDIIKAWQGKSLKLNLIPQINQRNYLRKV